MEIYTILLLVEKVFLVFSTFACLGLVDINSMASWFFRESKFLPHYFHRARCKWSHQFWYGKVAFIANRNVCHICGTVIFLQKRHQMNFLHQSRIFFVLSLGDGLSLDLSSQLKFFCCQIVVLVVEAVKLIPRGRKECVQSRRIGCSWKLPSWIKWYNTQIFRFNGGQINRNQPSAGGNSQKL